MSDPILQPGNNTTRDSGNRMWFLFQGLIVFAVCASNILYHWTPNSCIVGLAGMGLAYGLTRLLSALLCKHPGTACEIERTSESL